MVWLSSDCARESKKARGRVPGAGRKTSGRSPLRLAPRLTPSARDWGIWPLRQSESRRRGHHRSTDRKGSQRMARRAHHGILGPSSGHLPPPRRAGVPDSVRRRGGSRIGRTKVDGPERTASGHGPSGAGPRNWPQPHLSGGGLGAGRQDAPRVGQIVGVHTMRHEKSSFSRAPSEGYAISMC